MDLIHPSSRADVVEAIRDANAAARRLLVVGGRRHVDKGNPSEVDAELWTTQLDRLVAYEPAEMIAVVEAGMRIGELDRILADGGQEWPSDAPADATVGGVLASGASSPRRLKVGALRDTVLEAEIVTGDGRLVRSGARTVKNVTGYDLHKLVVGSLGTLGVIVQVAIKVRPLPHARPDAPVRGRPRARAGARGRGARFDRRPRDAGDGRASARGVAGGGRGADLERPARRRRDRRGRRAVPARTAVGGEARRRGGRGPPLELDVAIVGDAWGALAGVGLAWVGLGWPNGELQQVRDRVRAIGGIAPVVRGPGGLGDSPVAAPEVHRRLKEAFDPNGVLAPGRGWGVAQA